MKSEARAAKSCDVQFVHLHVNNLLPGIIFLFLIIVQLLQQGRVLLIPGILVSDLRV